VSPYPNHDFARLGSVLGGIRSIARKRLQYFRRHAPAARRARAHRAPDLALPVAEDVAKGTPIEGQDHCPPEFGAVERRLGTVDQKLPRNIPRHDCALRIGRLLLELLHQRKRCDALAGAIELAGSKGQDRGGRILWLGRAE
jgi:hypothetical protein